MKSKQLNLNLFIIVGTLFVFAIGYYLYLEVYTNGKEAHIIRTKSRIIEQMGQNLKLKIELTGTNSREYVAHLLDLNFKNKKTNKIYTGKSPSRKLKPVTDAQSRLKSMQNSSEEAFITMLKQKKDLRYFNPDLEYINARKPYQGDSLSSDSVIDVRSNPSMDYLSFTLLFGKKVSDFNNRIIEFRTRYEMLMTAFIQRNIFNQYILIIDNTVVYSTFPGMPKLTIRKSEKSSAAGSEGSSPKEVFNGITELNNSVMGQASISGVTSYDVDISNNQYKMFVSQVQVGQKTWQLCGLVDQNLINQAKRTIAPWIVIMIVIFMALIILGLPFIKLYVMSPTEQLTSGTLINFGVSLFLATSFVFWFVFYISNAFWYASQNGSKLKVLSKEIKDSFTNEIHNTYNQLCYYDAMASGKRSPLPDSANVLISNSFKPVVYPYFDYAFWIDTTGYQNGILTPFSVKEKPTSLATRDYFKSPDEWVLPGQDTLRFRMESIVSVTSGIAKVAMSKPSVIDHFVIAITGRFYSIIEPLLPQDYKFCIFDGDGKVWFHSDKSRNMQENFITECNQDKELYAAIYANATKTLDIEYYDEPYRIHIEPLSPMPLYLVTMFDKKREYAYQFQSLINTLLLSSGFVTFMISLLVAFFFCKRLFGRLTLKKQVLDFFVAKKKNNEIYLTMGILMVMITFLYLILVNPVNMLNPLIFGMIMVLFLFPYLIFALNGFSLKSYGRILFTIFCILFIIMVNVKSWDLLGSDDFLMLTLFQGGIIVLMITCYFVLYKGFSLNSEDYLISYYLFFLMGLILVLSVGPSIKIFEASVNHELVRQIKHDQLALARQSELRNTKLRRYYKLIKQDPQPVGAVDEVFRNRLGLGTYTDFNGTELSRLNKSLVLRKDTCCNDVGIKGNTDNESGDIIDFFRPMYDRISVETKYLEGDTLSNGNQIWCRDHTRLVFNYLSISEAGSLPVSYRITTGFNRPRIFNPIDSNDNHWVLFGRYDLLFVLLLIIIFFVVYRLALFGIKRMLGISILELYTPYDFVTHIYNQFKSGQSVLVIGSPFKDSAGYLKDQLNARFNLNLKDSLNELPEIKVQHTEIHNNIILIEGFADEFYKSANFPSQISQINERIRNKDQFLIYSTITPDLIMDYIGQKITLKVEGNIKSNPDAFQIIWDQLLLSFGNLLSNVNVMVIPEDFEQNRLTSGNVDELDRVNIQNIEQISLQRNMTGFIKKELSACTYLQRFSDEINEFHENLEKMGLPHHIIKSRVIMRLMDLGSLYYNNILDTCSTMEQYVLSDMAQDMVINIKNKSVINVLIQRGLFVADGCTIRFMNESFRKHVVNRFTTEEKLRLKEKLGDTGASWQGYKLFLVLLMVGLLSFLFIANRSILDNLNKLFIVLGGGTVLITNITGLLTRKDNASSK